MHKLYDVKRTRVSMSYFTEESADSILKRVERDNGRLQDDSGHYVETLTISEVRTVRFTARTPRNAEQQ